MIKIRVVSYNNEVSPEPLFAVFGQTAATIGRSNDNFLVLQDPKRYVSRLQASIKSDETRHFIVNLSQANPILVNGEEIAMGQEVDLHYGDEIQIGLYLLKAESPGAGAGAATNDVGNGTVVAPTTRFAAPDLAGTSNLPMNKATTPAPVGLDVSNFGGAGADPFADLLGAAASPPPAPVPAVPAARVTEMSAALATDPLGLDDLLGAPAAKTSATAAADPLGLDDLLGLSGAPAAVAAPAGANANPAAKVDPFGFDDLLGPPSSAPAGAKPTAQDNPFGFDDLLSGSSHTPLSPGRNAAIIPEDFDPFAMPSDAPRNSNDPLSGLSNDNVSLESIAGQKASIDSLMSSTDSAAGPSILDPTALGPTLSSETDPLALFGSESILPTRQDDRFLGNVASDHVSELNSHFALPQARQEINPTAIPEAGAPAAPLPLPIKAEPPAPIAKVAAAQPAPAPIAAEKSVPRIDKTPPAKESPRQQQAPANQTPLDGHALAEAFLRGANLPLDTIPSGVTLEWMEMMGRFVATATDGAVELIASRALVKREVKADLTMIVVRNNNPLKFLPDGQSALIQMLGRKIPGFMSPVEAMQDAYVDLRAHQIGVVAGMRAALDEVLRRFDPAMLEKKLKTRSLIDSLVAANRKAKMWDLYAELFKDIYIEAQDDFQTLFGKAFLTAYEAEIERFRQGGKQ